MLLAASACYFAFDARKQARYASWSADEASEKADESAEALKKVSQQVDMTSATTLRIEEQLGRHSLYGG
ncbi:hypothetical protein D3C78_1890590 [compost metagenome]